MSPKEPPGVRQAALFRWLQAEFLEVVRQLSPQRAVFERLSAELPAVDWQAVAVGKAAGAMALGALQAWGSRLRSGLLVSPYPLEPLAGFQCLQSSHPELDCRSFQAGQALLNQLRQPLPTLFLWSGGASALVEVVGEGRTQEQWQQEWRALYRQGLPITEMNRRRAEGSAIKGGKLLDTVAGESLSLVWSDVLQGAEWVGSGPTFRQPQPPQHRWEVLGDGHRLRSRFRERLQQAGYQVRLAPDLLASVQDCVEQVAAWNPEPGQAVLACAEMTLAVPQSGRGGRCQHFALQFLPRLRGTELVLMAAASDGLDGVSPAAGACVGASMDPTGAGDYLQAYASYDFFAERGCSWEPGPTGNNLNDLVVLLNPPTR